MKFFYKTSVDIIHPQYIAGWCFSRLNRQRRVELELFCGNKQVGETVADMFREDLRELGLHPDGRCGFEFVISKDDWTRQDKRLSLSLKGSGTVLAEIDSEGVVHHTHQWLTDLVGKRLSVKQGQQGNILFLHVPKTAGTSFNTLVRSLLPDDGSVAHIELMDSRKYKGLQQQYRYISGHLRVGVFKEFFDLSDSELYAIVREPYSHLHSHLKWLIKTATASDDNYFKNSNPVIYQLGQELSRIDLSNVDVLGRFAEEIRGAGAAFFDNMQTRYFLDREPARVSREDLVQAQENIGLFTLIGLTEEYFDFVEGFMRLNRLDKPVLKEKLNRSTTPPLFDWQNEQVREVLYPLVRFDLELYERIKKQRLG